MKTLQEFKDEIARQSSYIDWAELQHEISLMLSPRSIQVMIDALERAFEMYHNQFKPSEDHLKDLSDLFVDNLQTHTCEIPGEDYQTDLDYISHAKFIEIVSQRDRMIWDKACEKSLEFLREIANPIKSMQEKLKPGESLNGQYAIQLSNDANYLKKIAQDGIEYLANPDFKID